MVYKEEVTQNHAALEEMKKINIFSEIQVISPQT